MSIDVGEQIESLAAVRDPSIGPGEALGRVAEAATAFRREFAQTGTPDSVDTHDLITVPYPTKFGLWRAARTPSPFLSITNRLLIITWKESSGKTRTLLFEPSDFELGLNTPYFADLAAKVPDVATRALIVEHGSVLDRLNEAGIDPTNVDYLAFDHLHTQDVRRWLGTTTPQADISPNEPVKAIFPNAKLLVQGRELAELGVLHPVQRRWYQPETYRDLTPGSVVAMDGDVLLGPGVALIETPGHVTGNQSLVLNTNSGIWASSENVIAVECLEPRHSKIPGLAKWAETWGHDVVVNANTIEAMATQYNSIMLEKAIADRSQVDSRFVQFFPSSELTSQWSSPGTKPGFEHKHITHRQ